MKKIRYFFLLIIIFFVACENDFDVHADLKEIMVVYGLIDQNQSQQYIRINKAFLGEGDAFHMASVAGSINYNPKDLEVNIYKVRDGAFGSIDTLGVVSLYDTIFEKKDGLFSTDENIIYITSFQDKSFFEDDKDYILFIKNLETGNEVWSKTYLISELHLDIPPGKPIGFYEPIGDPPVLPLPTASTTLEWTRAPNGKIYQITARIYYTDYFLNDTVVNYIDWVQPTILYDGTNNMNFTFDGDAFLNTLARRIPDIDNVAGRRIGNGMVGSLAKGIEFMFSVGSEELQNYININAPFEGIVQERPAYTNIDNGIGLFSTRYNKVHIMNFTNTTRHGLSIDLDSLNFVYP